MIRSLAALSLLAVVAGAVPAAAQEACPDPKTALGVSRVVEIDSKSGPLFGEFSKYEKEPRFLQPMEVVLTFDDGPLPRYTKPILEALDKFCTKATFFSVGKMALAYPDMVKEVIGRGHTLGTHTWSHPLNLRRLSLDGAKDQIERGFAAVAYAAGQPIAPFFRFPGLSDSGPLLGYLQDRGVAAFTVDVVSNDSYIGSPQRLAQRTLAQIERQKGGIVLFHDIKSSTARALPHILAELKKGGYKIVHLRPKADFEPLPKLTAEIEAKYSKNNKTAEKTAEEKTADTADSSDGKPKLKRFYDAIALTTLEADAADPQVTELAPAPRERTHEGGTHATASTPVDADGQPAAHTAAKPQRRLYRRKSKSAASARSSSIPSLGSVISGKY